MARMFPSVFPGPWDVANPEFLVYQELKKLGDSYRVFYSKKLKGISHAKDECEIDFIIFNGSDVLICLEVKGGKIRYDGAQRKWFQNEKVLNPSPDGQASASTHALIKYLGVLVRTLNVDWALCFPNCQLGSERAEISEIPSALIIDETRLVDVAASIREIESYVKHQWAKRGLTPAEGEKLVQILTRSLGFVEKLGVRMARNNQQILEVTREQFELLDFLEINKRSLVSGAAGTGKTLMAQELAKRRVADGNTVLLLFFNKAIARKARFAFDKRSSVEVRTFHSFARRLIDECDADWWTEKSAKLDEFWNMAVPLKLLKLPLEKLPKFDVIIVDEGQDFKPEWFEFLQGLLKDQQESSFFVFLDERQDIFHHWNGIPMDIKPFKTPLRKNCRNTRAIVE
ncbi:MAG: NERD domain-containing protein [Pyrinomonadaceae bacterium]